MVYLHKFINTFSQPYYQSLKLTLKAFSIRKAGIIRKNNRRIIE
jgi:hypothetical protein